MSYQPSRMGKWHITVHARQQYITRYAPECAWEESLGQLIDISERAIPAGTRADGKAMYLDTSIIGAMFVVSHDNRPPHLPSLVTVVDRHGYRGRSASNSRVNPRKARRDRSDE